VIPMRKLAIALLLSQIAFAATTDLTVKFNDQMVSLVDLIKSIVPVVALGLFVLAGLVYAIGQVFDAQTRQKAQSWAMSMIVGGIIGVLLVIVAPWLVNFLLGFSAS